MEVVGQQPLFWQTFDLAPGDESASILAAYSTLWMMGRHIRIGVPIDRVFIHGRPDLRLTIDEGLFRSARAPAVRCAGPDTDEPTSAALGVALKNPLTEAGRTWPEASSPRSRSATSSPGPSWSSRRP